MSFPWHDYSVTLVTLTTLGTWVLQSCVFRVVAGGGEGGGVGPSGIPRYVFRYRRKARFSGLRAKCGFAPARAMWARTGNLSGSCMECVFAFWGFAHLNLHEVSYPGDGMSE